MVSPYCERAIEDAITHGNAILKFVSANDVDRTGGHQYGYLLPNPVWYMFSTHPPLKGVNGETEVQVSWQDGRITHSAIKWYGRDTRSEYRLTRFGRDFPFRTFDNEGDLLVLITVSYTEFIGYLLYDEEDIEEIQTALGVEIVKRWASYQGVVTQTDTETEDECISRLFRAFAGPLTLFPSGRRFSDKTREILETCVTRFLNMSSDDILTTSIDAEYQLFRLVERQICQEEILKMKRDIDDFLKVAASIMNRRKSRAGRSLENHVEYLLNRADIPHQMRPNIDGRPDVIVPSREAYYDTTYPLDRLFVVGIKTTCKDRWRQVLNEGKRVPDKHILTLQPSISESQLREMRDSRIKLIIPQSFRKKYPKVERPTIMNLDEFIESVRARLRV
jgi:EcoRII C terminal/Restriction endonuclease EcoRII, N-terminal